MQNQSPLRITNKYTPPKKLTQSRSTRSPFSQISEEPNTQILIARITELEIMLRKNQTQYNLFEKEYNKLILENEALKSQLSDKASEVDYVVQQIRDANHQKYNKHNDEVNKLHQLLKEKNSVILQWTNRYVQLERKYESDIQSLKNQYEQTFQVQIDKRMQDHFDELERKKDELEEQRKQLKDMSVSIDETQKSYEIRSAQLQKEIQNQRAKNEALNQAIVQLKDQIASYQNEKHQWIEKYSEAVQKQYSKVDENKEKIIELRTINQLQEQKIKELKDEKNQLQNELHKYLSLGNAGINSQQLEFEKLVSKDKENKIRALENEKEQLMLEIEKIRQEGYNQRDRVQQEFQTQKEKFLEEQVQLKQRNLNLQQQLNQFEEKNSKLQQQILTLQKENQQVVDETSQIIMESRKSKDNNLNNSLLESEISNLKGKISDYERQIYQLSEKNRRLESLVQEKQEEGDQWRRKVEEIQKECDIKLDQMQNQYENYSNQRNSSDLMQIKAQMEHKIDYLSQQVSIANKESEVYKQRAKDAEDDKRKVTDQLSSLKMKQESELRQLKEQVVNLKNELLEKNGEMMLLQEQLEIGQREKFDQQQQVELLTDRLLKLELAWQQTQAQESQEFSFQREEEQQSNDAEDQVERRPKEYDENDFDQQQVQKKH